MRGNRGFALVLTLVVTALMVAVLTELIHQVYVDTSLSRGFRDGQQASLLAESGVEGGKKFIPWYFSADYTSPVDIPTQEDEVGKLEITVIEESGKINLNLLVYDNGLIDQFTHDALKRLSKPLGIKEEVWFSLADWLDKGSNQQSFGAEDTFYLARKQPHRGRNGKLKSLAELSMVEGFSPADVNKLARFVTVHSEQTSSIATDQKININTAPNEVIAALSDTLYRDKNVVDRIDGERRQKKWFKPIYTDSLSRSQIPGGAAIAQELAATLIYKGTVFRIISKATVKDSTRTVEAVWRWSDNKILSWQEY